MSSDGEVGWRSEGIGMLTRWVMMSDSNTMWSTLAKDGTDPDPADLVHENGESAVIVYREVFEDRCVATLLPAARTKINVDKSGRTIKSDTIDRNLFFIILESTQNDSKFVSHHAHDMDASINFVKTFTQLTFDKAMALATKKGL
ncbi:hypothetical protein ACLBXM_09965 [Xanthobacteraceae bacterium A53D]